VFLVCDTFRMSGHAEHDDQRYVEPERLAQWAAKDPLPRFEAWLAAQGWTPDPGLGHRLEAGLLADSEAALGAPWPEPDSLALGLFTG
jgi:TPP-dependent pyruvate/acetoin dehydrogenase alpha subunit